MKRAQKKRIGIYYWAGPGTIRMTELKFPGTKINHESFLQAYDYPVLKKIKTIFNLTDAWVTFSWGFSESREREDYNFIQKKLLNFQKLGIKTHAYIQGCNLVLSDHFDKDFFCRDSYDKLIPYHRGRKMTCSNNPYFVDYLQRKIKLALKEKFDGIFIDNINQGQFPIVVDGVATTFFGCKCKFCQKKFEKEYHYQIPNTFHINDSVFNAYVSFRSNSLMNFVKKISIQIKEKDKQFGTNSFNPLLNPLLFYGIDLKVLERLQDYLLFENHDLPRVEKGEIHSNYGLKSLILESNKPVFVVSYKKGIGRDNMYTQKEFDAIFTESQVLGYMPCYKGSEFISDNTWHAIEPHGLRFPQKIKIPQKTQRISKIIKGKKLLPLYNFLYNPLLTGLFESKILRHSFQWLYYRAIN